MLFTALIFSFIIIPKKKNLSDEEIKQKAAELGMVENTKTPVPKNSATPIPKDSSTPSPTMTLNPSGSPTPTMTSEPSGSPTPTLTPSSTPTPTFTPVPTPTPAPTFTPAPTPSSVPTPTLQPTNGLIDPSPTESASNPSPTPEPGEYVEFTIVANMTSEQISIKLAQYGIISSDSVDGFNAYVIRNKLENSLRVGTYKLQKNMTFEQICSKICR